MASSRLERIGTIFSRITGLLRAGAMKEEDVPIWYNVYRSFPPKLEPRFDRQPPPESVIKPIFYPEDAIRARFYASFGSPGLISMFEGPNDVRRRTPVERFVAKYKQLERSGVAEHELFEATTQALVAEGMKLTIGARTPTPASDKQPKSSSKPLPPSSPSLDRNLESGETHAGEKGILKKISLSDALKD